MKETRNSRKSCDGCGARGMKLFLVRNLRELEGCLLSPKLQHICEHCREQIFLELEALKRQAARMSSTQRKKRTSRATKRS
jgi:hypothetical protein